ncbi:hypothetical protein [Psychromonas marina]
MVGATVALAVEVDQRLN